MVCVVNVIGHCVQNASQESKSIGVAADDYTASVEIWRSVNVDRKVGFVELTDDILDVAHWAIVSPLRGSDDEV
jgi:hypothetical protein